MAERSRGLHLSFLAASVAYAMFAQGAFYPYQALTLAALALAAAFTAPGRLPLTVWAAFAVLAAAIGISVILVPNSDPRVAWAGLIVAASAARVGAWHRQQATMNIALSILTLSGAAAAVAGLIGVGWHFEPWALEAQGIWRAASTLTYANSLGAVLIPCLAAVVMRISRVNAAAHYGDRLALALITAGLLTSMSRAAWLAGLAGLIAAALVDRTLILRCLHLSALPLFAGAIVAASAIPSMFGDPQPVLLAVGVLAAALVCLLLPKPARILAVALLFVAVIVSVVATGKAQGLADRLVNEDRSRIWQVSYQAGLDELPTGQGLGRFAVFETRHGKLFRIQYAHNEAIQVLVETGAVGVGAYLVAGGLLAVALLRRRRSNAIEIAVAISFLMHGMLDFVWHVPALILLAFLFVGSAAGSSTFNATDSANQDPPVGDLDRAPRAPRN